MVKFESYIDGVAYVEAFRVVVRTVHHVAVFEFDAVCERRSVVSAVNDSAVGFVFIFGWARRRVVGAVNLDQSQGHGMSGERKREGAGNDNEGAPTRLRFPPLNGTLFDLQLNTSPCENASPPETTDLTPKTCDVKTLNINRLQELTLPHQAAVPLSLEYDVRTWKRCYRTKRIGRSHPARRRPRAPLCPSLHVGHVRLFPSPDE